MDSNPGQGLEVSVASTAEPPVPQNMDTSDANAAEGQSSADTPALAYDDAAGEPHDPLADLLQAASDMVAGAERLTAPDKVAVDAAVETAAEGTQPTPPPVPQD